MAKKLLNLSFITSVILFIGVFIGSLYIPTDPDLGWHLKYGEYFFRNGDVLRDNIFSSLMTDYKWTNSSWGTDLITYFTFKNFGFLGLSLLGALTTTITFYFISKASRLDLFEKSVIFPVLLYLVSPVLLISFRGQMISLLLTTFMYFILSRYETNKKLVFVLLPLFTVWSNLHGQFIAGIGLFILWTIVFSIKEMYFTYKKDLKRFIKENKFLLITFLLSLFFPLINPFGYHVYIEAIGHFDDPMQKFVAEFLPPGDFSSIWWHQVIMGAVMTIGVFLLGNSKKNFDKAPFYVPSFLMLILSFWIRRYAWTFYYSSVFLIQPIVNFIKPPDKKHALYVSLIISICFLFSIILIKQPFNKYTQMNWNEFCKHSIDCSPRASNIISNMNVPSEELLTIYDYGGYLIWNYPNVKPTIDGRMHLWRDENSFSGFEYFYPIEQNQIDINKTKYNVVLTSHKKPIFKRLSELTESGEWKVIHVDKYSAVFVRNVSKTD